LKNKFSQSVFRDEDNNILLFKVSSKPDVEITAPIYRSEHDEPLAVDILASIPDLWNYNIIAELRRHNANLTVEYRQLVKLKWKHLIDNKPIHKAMAIVCPNAMMIESFEGVIKESQAVHAMVFSDFDEALDWIKACRETLLN